MASQSSVAPLFSDLRGVTVRNTFLEFEDVGADNFPEVGSGFTRQASEPAKPFNRQVSEQTTTGSGATMEESTTEPEEGYSQLASYLSSTLPQVGGNDRQGGRARQPAADVAGPTLQAAFQADAASAMTWQVTPQAPDSQAGLLRFCPNCGAKVEPNHRFCPYCCYPLQPQQMAQPSQGVAMPTQQQQQPQQPPQTMVPDGTVAGPSAPNLLEYLRRFRYVEACSSDVELARVLCLNFMQTGKAT